LIDTAEKDLANAALILASDIRVEMVNSLRCRRGCCPSPTR
jgi:hypothetical protein